MTFFTRIALVASIALGLARTAGASPITYTFSGSLDANSFSCIMCNGSDNTTLGSSFNLVFTSDTSAVVDGGGGFWRVNNISGTFTDGSFSATLTNVTIVVNSNTMGGGAESVNFFNSSFSNGLGFNNNSSLAGYQLKTSIGPLTDGGNLSPTGAGGTGTFSTTGTSFVHLDQNSANSLTFTAATTAAPVPEPATLTLVSLGLVAAATCRRRKVR